MLVVLLLVLVVVLLAAPPVVVVWLARPPAASASTSAAPLFLLLPKDIFLDLFGPQDVCVDVSRRILTYERLFLYAAANLMTCSPYMSTPFLAIWVKRSLFAAV